MHIHSLPMMLALVLGLHIVVLLMLFKMNAPVQATVTMPVITGQLLKPEPKKPTDTVVPVAARQIKPKTARVKRKVSKPRPEPLTVTKPEPVKIKPEPVEITPVTEQKQDRLPTLKTTPNLPEVIEPRVDAIRQNSNIAPVYPRVSLRRKEQGRVILEVLILKDGTVGEIRIKQSSGYPRLDQAALKAVKRWQYIPAQQGGDQIDYWYQQPIMFSIRT